MDGKGMVDFAGSFVKEMKKRSSSTSSSNSSNSSESAMDASSESEPGPAQTLEQLYNHILLLDNFSAHANAEAAEIFELAKILLLFLPPNTTPFLQPLDVAVNYIFKKILEELQRKYREILYKETNSLADPRVTRQELARRVLEAWERISIETIQTAFRKPGLSMFVSDTSIQPQAVQSATVLPSVQASEEEEEDEDDVELNSCDIDLECAIEEEDDDY